MNKLTKERLAEMSDDKVELALARLARKTTISISEDGFSDLEFSEIDINNWNDIMPLAVEHKIHFGPDGDLDNPLNHYAISDKSICSENLIEFVYSSPQRTIACCLILVLQEREA